MSGRLIISGKKSYTPWNAANVERVLRDERIEKERLEKQEQKSRDRQNGLRIEAMKIRKYGEAKRNDGENATASVIENQHINLFENEEKKMLKSMGLEGNREENHAKKKTNCAGIMPVVYLSKRNKEECEADSEDFYKRKAILRPDVDEILKGSIDPMRRFHKHEKNHEESPPMKLSSMHTTDERKHRKKSHYSDNESVSSTSSSSVEEKARRRKRRHSRHRDKKRRKKTHKKTRGDRTRIREDQDLTPKKTKSSKLDELRRRHLKRNAKEAEREKDITKK